MDKGLVHKGYAGSIDVSLEDGCLHGRVLFVNDLITYEGNSVSELEASFKAAVDRYLAHCAMSGKTPDRSCSGNLNVRLGADLHRKAATAAVQNGCSLNDFVVRAVEAAVSAFNARQIEPAQASVVTSDQTVHVIDFGGRNQALGAFPVTVLPEIVWDQFSSSAHGSHKLLPN